jgi:predicted NACHT family NTPase
MSVKEILGSAFKEDCQVLDTKTLVTIWYQLNLLSLPEKFNWEQVDKRYLRKIKALMRESDELRSILNSQHLEEIQQNTKELAGIAPEFDLPKYQEAIRKRYGNLNLQSLDTGGSAYNELKLWQMFIAQNVREVHKFLPQIHELPQVHQRRLRESNQLEAAISPEKLDNTSKLILSSQSAQYWI